MYKQTLKNIDDIMHKETGCISELDYNEQSNWLLFLKYLNALEADKLPPLLKLSYNAVNDALAELRNAMQVRKTFEGMQRYLYK